MKKTYYEMLGVAPDATLEEIRNAAKRLVEKYHPSKYPGNPQAEARFKQIKSMYAILADAKKRSAYDTSLGIPHIPVVETAITVHSPKTECHQIPEVQKNGVLPKKNELQKKRTSPVHPLLRDEKIIYSGKVHWSVYLNPLLILFISVYLTSHQTLWEIYLSEFDFLQSRSTYVRMGLWTMMGIGILMLLHAMYIHLITQILITSRRTLAKLNLFSQRVIEISHAQFETIEVKQSPLGNLLGFGSIKMRGTKGRGIGGLKISIPCLSSPKEFEKKLLYSIKNYFEK